MQVNVRDKHRILMQMTRRRPGRPRSAQPELRDNNYRDENGRYQLTELKPWHERIVDYMLLNPEAKRVDVARAFKVTPEWVGQLLKTDAFIAYYNRRMEAHGQHIQQEVVRKMQGAAVAGVEKITERINHDQMSNRELNEATGLMLKGLGMGGDRVSVTVPGGGGNTMVQVNVGAEALERARQAWLEKNKDGPKPEAALEDYKNVTSAMEAGYDQVQAEGEIEDAELLPPDGDGET